MMGAIDFHLRVPFNENWRNVELLRTAILNCLVAISQESDFTESIAIIAGELLENAIKYGDWSGDKRRYFRLSVQGDIEKVRVEVASPARQDSDKVEELMRTVGLISNAESPLAAYQQRLTELATTDPKSGRSQLGLVRIAYESGCDIETAFEDGVVRVAATCRL